MAKLWLLQGDHDAEGWRSLRSDFEAEKIDIVHLDPNVWAMVESEDAPEGYEGLSAAEPEDGLYLDPQGNPLFVASGRMVKTPDEVVSALGDDAVQLLERVKDPIRVLELLGRAF
jgi:hypothetical protein